MSEVAKDCLSNEEIEEIKKVFSKYDFNKTGKIKPKQFLKEMASLGLNIKAHYIYKIIKDLDTDENEKNGGISIDELINAMNNTLGNTQTEDGIKHIFDLFKEDPNDKTITLDGLKRLATSFGMKVSDEEIKNMLEKSSQNGQELTFEEFYKLMAD